MKIKINKKSYELHNSFRAGMYFEQIMDRPINFSKLSQLDLFTFFYCVVQATLEYNKADVSMTINEFKDWIDDNGGELVVAEFTTWYIKEMEKEADLAKKKFGKKEGAKVDENF